VSKGDAVSLIGKVELEGDFFTHDPGKTLGGNIRDMMDLLAKWMEDEAMMGIAAASGSMPGWTGYTLEHVRGYVTQPGKANRWRVSAAVGIPTYGMDDEQAIRTKAAGASIERRFHPMRRVKQGVYRSRPILQANLTKGLE
jgi:hypothetical protein